MNPIAIYCKKWKLLNMASAYSHMCIFSTYSHGMHYLIISKTESPFNVTAQSLFGFSLHSSVI